LNLSPKSWAFTGLGTNPGSLLESPARQEQASHGCRLLKDLAKQAGFALCLESITIDAYHYPNSYLFSISRMANIEKVKGRFIPMMPKGWPGTLGHLLLENASPFHLLTQTAHPVRTALW